MTYEEKMKRLDTKIGILIDRIRESESNRKASKYKWILFQHLRTMRRLSKLDAWGVLDSKKD